LTESTEEAGIHSSPSSGASVTLPTIDQLSANLFKGSLAGSSFLLFFFSF
jgi:hypothetical protein